MGSGNGEGGSENRLLLGVAVKQDFMLEQIHPKGRERADTGIQGVAHEVARGQVLVATWGGREVRGEGGRSHLGPSSSWEPQSAKNRRPMRCVEG